VQDTRFANERDVAAEGIGPGEDVFMVGRFMDHDGGAINQPAVRFGNISTMPANIKQPNGVIRPCYCIDLHSRAGFSGSPVYAFRTFGQDLSTGGSERTTANLTDNRFTLEY
jgi:hypothetical protein